MDTITERRRVDEERGAQMRRLFPKLSAWGSTRATRDAAERVYACLAAATTAEELDRLGQALRHYPTEAIEEVALRDGRAAFVRPVLPSDAELQRAFVRALSARSRHRRFHTGLSELPEPLVRYLTAVDHVDHFALLGTAGHGASYRQVAEARWVRRADEPAAADFAIAVADDHQGGGLGARMMDALERGAAARGVRSLFGSVLRTNGPMIRWLAARGGRVMSDATDPSVVWVELTLPAGRAWREAA